MLKAIIVRGILEKKKDRRERRKGKEGRIKKIEICLEASLLL